jgi:hypothetical protein
VPPFASPEQRRAAAPDAGERMDGARKRDGRSWSTLLGLAWLAVTAQQLNFCSCYVICSPSRVLASH